MAYAWTDIYYGGDVEERSRANGQLMKVVTKRNIIPRGEKVTQKDIGVDDDGWQTLLDGGSVREYPLPEGADEYTSPAAAMVANLVDEDGNIDIDKLIQAGLAQPEAVPVEEDEADEPKKAAPKAETPKGV